MLNAIIRKLLPYMLFAIGFKCLVWVFENTDWWPQIENPGIILGVVGFGIAVLLGAKLSVVNTRLYSIEDKVCLIVGSLRIMKNINGLGPKVHNWSSDFESTLRDPEKTGIVNLREKTDNLVRDCVDAGHDSSNLSGFSRDVSFVLHRATAEIPIAYENFLSMMTTIYTITIALVITGIAGFIGIFIVVLVLVGSAILIEDMDHPLDYGKLSMIRVNLEPLTHFNSK